MQVHAVSADPMDGIFAVELQERAASAQLLNTFVKPISSYAGPSPILPQARQWLMRKLLRTPPPAFPPVTTLSFIRQGFYGQMLQHLQYCLMGQRDRSNVLNADVQAVEVTWPTYGGGFLEPSSAAVNCTLTSFPNPRGLQRDGGSDVAALPLATPGASIYELLDSESPGGEVLDVNGASREVRRMVGGAQRGG